MIARLSPERWVERGFELPYFDGRCEAQTIKEHQAALRSDFRCRRMAWGARGGIAVCWHHAYTEHLLPAPAALKFRRVPTARRTAAPTR